MSGDLFDSTIPFGEPQLAKASTYRRFLNAFDVSSAASMAAQPSQLKLSTSLLADLSRSEQDSGESEVVEVFAACVRHSTRVTVHLHCDRRVLPLTVFPREHLLHCPVDLEGFMRQHLAQVSVMHIEPALLRPPGHRQHQLIGELPRYHALHAFLWELALRGPRQSLLPQISGPAVYRVAPSLALAALPVSGVMRAAIARLRTQPVPLSTIAGWPTFDREKAARLLNALYLQTGLMVSRSHPQAAREGWFN